MACALRCYGVTDSGSMEFVLFFALLRCKENIESNFERQIQPCTRLYVG
ncbi:MAG: hypothetical protein P8X74_01370 [Reinekea sp.]